MLLSPVRREGGEDSVRSHSVWSAMRAAEAVCLAWSLAWSQPSCLCWSLPAPPHPPPPPQASIHALPPHLLASRAAQERRAGEGAGSVRSRHAVVESEWRGAVLRSRKPGVWG